MTFEEAVEKGQVWAATFTEADYSEPWPAMGSSDASDLDRLVEESEPGFLMLTIGDESENIQGIIQVSHRRGTAQEFMSRADVDDMRKWWPELMPNCLEVRRAWFLRKPMPLAELAPGVDIFAELGTRLTGEQAAPILTWEIYETPLSNKARFEPMVSKQGPSAKSSYEAELKNPQKHLYVLELEGDAETFLGRKDAAGNAIIKPGYSHDPDTRLAVYNAHLPQSKDPLFYWRLHWSTMTSGLAAYTDVKYAEAGERAMQEVLTRKGESLGNEFFLVSIIVLKAAIESGVKAAEAEVRQADKGSEAIT